MAPASLRSKSMQIVAREGNVLLVRFNDRPEPPTPVFPGAGALRAALAETAGEFVTACGKPTGGGSTGFAAA